MALLREPMVMYDSGFEAEASAFDALGYGGAGVDAAALFDFAGYGYAHDEQAGAYVPDGAGWAGAGTSVLTFDRPAVVVSEEEADCDAWNDAMDEDQASSSTIGFDPVSGCFSLTQSSGGARRPFGLLFPSTSNDAAAPVRVSSQKRPHAVRMQPDAETPAAKRQCGVSRKTSKPKPPPATTTSPPKDPQSQVAKVTPLLKLHLLPLPLLEVLVLCI